MKKVLLTILLLATTILPAAAYSFSAVAPSGQTLYYNIVNGNAQVTYQNTSSPHYTNLTGSLTIPTSVTYNGTTYSVSSIGSGAFRGCSSLTSVTIGNSVTSIGAQAFYDCSGLTSVTIPNSVTSIGDNAFDNCSGLTSVTIPNSVTSIGYYTFGGCSSLTSVTIPNSVTSIGQGAFSGCSGLTSLTIPNSVTSIGIYAFYGCSGLTSVTIGNSVTSIGDDAFNMCESLTSVYYTGDIAGWCGINFVNDNGEVNSNPLFYAHNLYINNNLVTDLVIPNSVTVIKPYVFCYATCLTSVTLPNSVTSIGQGAFAASGLTSVTIPNSITFIDIYVFGGCTELTSVSIPNSVTSIGEGAFNSCSSLSSITIPNSVTSIGWGTFMGCSSLTSVTIGTSVTSIGPYAFNGCTGLTEMHSLNSVPPTIEYYTFDGVPTNIPIYIPCGSVSYYTSATYWRNFVNFIEIGTYSFSAVSNNNSMGTVQIITMPTCSNPHAEVFASPNSGYLFDHWSDGSIENPYSLIVTEDMSLTAYFSPIGSQPTTYYTITVSANDAEMGTVTGGGSFAEGTTTTITATANSGYHFVQWQDGNTEASRSITVTADAEYTAYFAANGINYYTITVTSDDAEMGTVTGGGSFAEGTTTTITATANSGYHFVQWQDGNTEASRSITVTADAEYTAYFAANGANDYTITVIAQNPSMGSTTGSGTFAYGTATTITAEPYEGYYFVQWNDGNTQRIRTITVTGNATYTAYFDRSNGIDDITSDQIKIHSRGSEIVIEGAENSDALIYDVMGRIVHKGRIEGPIHVNAMGVYMVKIANHPSHKVVVK